VREMQCGNRKIICEKFTPPFIKNGTLSKSRDEIFIRGEGCNTLGVCLAFGHRLSRVIAWH
jgi:hypothetical protein